MIEVLKQVLEALESCTPQDTSTGHVIHAWHDEKLVNKSITSLRQAIAELESQEPDYWLGYGLQAHTEKPFDNATALYTHPPQRTEGRVCCQQYDICLEPCTSRGRHLKQRTWVGLTDEEIDDIANSILADDPVLWWRKLSQAIEAKLKQKNGYAEEKNT